MWHKKGGKLPISFAGSIDVFWKDSIQVFSTFPHSMMKTYTLVFVKLLMA
jgi:hypothetical protein